MNKIDHTGAFWHNLYSAHPLSWWKMALFRDFEKVISIIGALVLAISFLFLILRVELKSRAKQKRRLRTAHRVGDAAPVSTVVRWLSGIRRSRYTRRRSMRKSAVMLDCREHTRFPSDTWGR